MVVAGLKELRAQYPFQVVSSAEQAYAIINASPAIMEYGPTFHLLQVGWP
jgi:hypothetical protein